MYGWQNQQAYSACHLLTADQSPEQFVMLVWSESGGVPYIVYAKKVNDNVSKEEC